ncbi:MAG: response regulator receiver protein [Alphaproteobacteria bacterium]|nr:response regulator receiver protein [Alphaproteobacteria bacterium]
MAFSSDSKVVLVVDDEIFARLFAVQVFLDQGYTVLEADCAEQGLDVLDRNDDVDVLFTDISMPGEMDGLELVRHVKAEHPHIAFLVTSGHGDPTAEGLPEGSWFLAKPYSANALMTAITEACAASPRRIVSPFLPA